MPHILFISYDGMTDPLGQSQVIPYLKGLTAHGYQFTILSAEKPDKLIAGKETIVNLLKGFPIKWEFITYHKRPPVISGWWDVLLMKKKGASLHRADPFDMVHTRSGTPALIGCWMKKKFGIRFLNDVRDFYADSRIDSGQWNQKYFIYRMVYKYFKKKEAEQFRLNDGIVCLTNAAKKILEQKLLNKKIPVQVIPCSVDLNLFNPDTITGDTRKDYKTRLGIREEDFIITYLGSIGTWYLIDELMEFLKVLIRQNPNARMLFISPDAKEAIEAIVKHHEIAEEKVIITKAARKEVPVLLSLSQFSVFFIKPCYSKQASSPTKHGEMMGMGIPVITNSGVGDLEEIISKSKTGFLIRNFTTKEFDEIITQMNVWNPNPVQIRELAFEYYDLNKAIEKYKLVYGQTLTQG